MDFRIVQSRPDMADQLAAIQRACFPDLADEELITADQYRAQIKVFPEGQMAAVGPDDAPVACSTDLICKIDFNNYQHRYIDMVGQNWLTTHDPAGDWLYGADIGVHPDYRGMGLSRRLYEERQNLIRRLNLRGHVAGGLMRGYGAVKEYMTPTAYLRDVAAGKIFDPTLSVQMKAGFKITGLIEDYVDDPGCDNKAALIVWHNPDFKA